MGLGEIKQFYDAYKTIKKFAGSGAVKVAQLSSRVDALIIEYAKIKPLIARGLGTDLLSGIQTKLAAIIGELEPMTQRALVLPSVGKTAAFNYVEDAIEAGNNVQMACNEMRRIEIEQFTGALPGSAGKKAYWPTTRQSLSRLKENAWSVAVSLRGTANAMTKDIDQATATINALLDARNDKSVTRELLNDMENQYKQWVDRERQLREQQDRYFACVKFFQLKFEGYKARIETGDVLWVKEQKK
jgi:hypothetical protein